MLRETNVVAEHRLSTSRKLFSRHATHAFKTRKTRFQDTQRTLALGKYHNLLLCILLLYYMY